MAWDLVISFLARDGCLDLEIGVYSGCMIWILHCTLILHGRLDLVQ